MTIKKKFSIGILTLICALMIVFAFEVFLLPSSGNLIPGTEQNIGVPSVEIGESGAPLLSVFYFTSIIAVLTLLLSLSIGIVILVYGPFRKRKKWASLAIFTMLIVWLISAFLIYYIQPHAPRLLWVLLLGLVLIALILEILKIKKKV